MWWARRDLNPGSRLRRPTLNTFVPRGNDILGQLGTVFIPITFYRYLVEWWKKIYGAQEKTWYALELARRVKIVLYLGGEHSCLQGLEKHNMEHCPSCPPLAENRESWSRVPNTPFY